MKKLVFEHLDELVVIFLFFIIVAINAFRA